MSLLLSLACASDRTVLLEGEGSGSGSGSGDPAPATTSTASTTNAPSSTGTTTEPADDTSAPGTDSTGLGFVQSHDVGGDASCNPFMQSCPAGQKCTFLEIESGWIAARCVPIAVDPVGPGETCHSEGPTFSGLDDCEIGAMCWDVDPETFEGFCVPLCMGSWEDAYCADPGNACAMSGGDAIALCLPVCQPLEQDCPESQACYPIQDAWSCAPDASDGLGAYGDPCEFINVCESGLVCVESSELPPGLPCEGAAGCCTEVCDLSNPLGDQQCTSATEGAICKPWYEPGTAMPGYDDVGTCGLP